MLRTRRIFRCFEREKHASMRCSSPSFGKAASYWELPCLHAVNLMVDPLKCSLSFSQLSQKMVAKHASSYYVGPRTTQRSRFNTWSRKQSSARLCTRSWEWWLTKAYRAATSRNMLLACLACKRCASFKRAGFTLCAGNVFIQCALHEKLSAPDVGALIGSENSTGCPSRM